MYYTIFDRRPQHNGKPFLFDCGFGYYHPFVSESYDEAVRLAEKMNANSSLTTYEVKPYVPTVGEVAASNTYFK